MHQKGYQNKLEGQAYFLRLASWPWLEIAVLCCDGTCAPDHSMIKVTLTLSLVYVFDRWQFGNIFHHSLNLLTPRGLLSYHTWSSWAVSFQVLEECITQVIEAVTKSLSSDVEYILAASSTQLMSSIPPGCFLLICCHPTGSFVLLVHIDLGVCDDTSTGWCQTKKPKDRLPELHWRILTS